MSPPLYEHVFTFHASTLTLDLDKALAAKAWAAHVEKGKASVSARLEHILSPYRAWMLLSQTIEEGLFAVSPPPNRGSREEGRQ